MDYVPRARCTTCLEHVLLYLDVGLSEATSRFLAGLFHVLDGHAPSYQFGKIARLHLMRRYEELLDADFDRMLNQE